jgi:uncharacterized protein YjbJ (UPF0337 family)
MALKERHPMDESTQDKAEGKFHELKGKVKEKAGRATNDPDLESEGQTETLDGKIQKKIGQVEKVFGV